MRRDGHSVCAERVGCEQVCAMCTLPAEGVSFCLSAAAKSLLNKKADAKVGRRTSSAGAARHGRLVGDQMIGNEFDRRPVV